MAGHDELRLRKPVLNEPNESRDSRRVEVRFGLLKQEQPRFFRLQAKRRQEDHHLCDTCSKSPQREEEIAESQPESLLL